MKALPLALLSGVLFGAGLAVSGMVDPQRVRAFLDLFGRWDPTLAFVMAGAIAPMALAWRWRATLDKPWIGSSFNLPETRRIDRKLATGAVLFGVGWGVSGLCPGPAIADLALTPLPAAVFVAAMFAGMAVDRWMQRREMPC